MRSRQASIRALIRSCFSLSAEASMARKMSSSAGNRHAGNAFMFGDTANDITDRQEVLKRIIGYLNPKNLLDFQGHIERIKRIRAEVFHQVSGGHEIISIYS